MHTHTHTCAFVLLMIPLKKCSLFTQGTTAISLLALRRERQVSDLDWQYVIWDWDRGQNGSCARPHISSSIGGARNGRWEVVSIWISGAIHTLWVLRGREKVPVSQRGGGGEEGQRVPVGDTHFIVTAVRADVLQHNGDSLFTEMARERRLLHRLTVILMR